MFDSDNVEMWYNFKCNKDFFPDTHKLILLSNILSVNYQIDGLKIYLWCSKISHTANGLFSTQD